MKAPTMDRPDIVCWSARHLQRLTVEKFILAYNRIVGIRND